MQRTNRGVGLTKYEIPALGYSIMRKQQDNPLFKVAECFAEIQKLFTGQEPFYRQTVNRALTHLSFRGYLLQHNGLPNPDLPAGFSRPPNYYEVTPAGEVVYPYEILRTRFALANSLEELKESILAEPFAGEFALQGLAHALNPKSAED